MSTHHIGDIGAEKGRDEKARPEPAQVGYCLGADEGAAAEGGAAELAAWEGPDWS
jgi:hypothetical protein